MAPHDPSVALIALTSTQLAILLVAGLIGGLVRGYSGFGFALAAVPILGTISPPALAVPSVLIVECLIGLFTVVRERRQIDRPALGKLIAGTLFGTPVGLLVLSTAPTDWTRVMVAAAALFAVLVLWRRPHLPWMAGSWPLFAGGLASGLLNGGTAMSGPPAILVLLGSPMPDRSARAVLMSFILASAALAVSITAIAGMQTATTLTIAALMIPGAMIGVTFGSWLFGRLPARFYRRGSFVILLLISALTVSTTIWNLTQST